MPKLLLRGGLLRMLKHPVTALQSNSDSETDDYEVVENNIYCI